MERNSVGSSTARIPTLLASRGYDMSQSTMTNMFIHSTNICEAIVYYCEAIIYHCTSTMYTVLRSGDSLVYSTDTVPVLMELKL